MANTGTADLVTDLASPPDVTQSYFVRKLLMNAQLYNYYERWADDVDLPQGEGRNVIVRRYAHLPLAGPLAQGVPPPRQMPTLSLFHTSPPPPPAVFTPPCIAFPTPCRADNSTPAVVLPVLAAAASTL